MKRLYLLSILIFSIQVSSAQVFEIAEDRGYYNTFNNVIGLNDSTLVFSGNYSLTNSYFSGAYIKAIDHSGNLLWQYLTPLDTEVRNINNLVLLPNGNIAALGSEQWCCDCTSPFFQIHIFSPDGELLEQQSFENLEFWNQNLKTALAGNLIGAVFPNNSFPNEYALKTFSSDGELWSYDLGEDNAVHLVSQGNSFLVFGNNGIRRIDETGMLTGFFPYNAPPDRILEVDANRTIILADEVIYELNADLEINTVFFESITTDIEYWLRSGDFIYVIAAGEIRKLNLNYEMEQCTFFEPLPDHELNATWCNEEYCVFAGDKTVSFEGYPYDTNHSSAVAYTIMLDNSQMEHFPDVAVRSLSINTININNPETNVYSFTGNVTGYLVNTGDITIESAQVFHFIGPNVACGLELNHIAFDNISLQVGDSIEFNIDVEQRSGWYPNNEWIANFCVYATSPNNFSDRDNSNDVGCASQSFGVGIFENSKNENIGIFPNPAGNQITLQLNPSSVAIEYLIVDLSGKTAQSGVLQTNSLPQIDVSGLENGSYLLQLYSGNSHYLGKFIVVR